MSKNVLQTDYVTIIILILVNGFSFFSFQEFIWQFIVTVLLGLMKEKDYMNQQLWWSRQCKHILFKKFECSSFKLFIQAYKYKRDVRIG